MITDFNLDNDYDADDIDNNIFAFLFSGHAFLVSTKVINIGQITKGRILGFLRPDGSKQ